MEPKGTFKNPLLTPTPVYYERREIDSVRELDSVALLKLCAHDPSHYAAWHEFLSRFIDRIRFFIARALRSEAARSGVPPPAPEAVPTQQDPEDLVQEVLVRLAAQECRLLKRFRGTSEGAIVCYLSVICTSVAIDHYRYRHRQRRRAPASSLDALDPTGLERIGISRGDLQIEQTVLVQEIRQLVTALLGEEVPDVETRTRCLLIFNLYLFDGLSLAEISRYCGINLSKKGVDKVLTKIIGRLKEKLTTPRRSA